MNVFLNELLLRTICLIVWCVGLDDIVTVCFSWWLVLIAVILSVLLPVLVVVLVIVLILITGNCHLLGILVLKFVDKLVSILHVFMCLLFLGNFHEFHSLKSFRLVYTFIFLLMFHLFEFLLQIHNSLLSIVLIIILLRQILKYLIIYLVLLELFLSDLIDFIYCILDRVFVVLVKS